MLAGGFAAIGRLSRWHSRIPFASSANHPCDREAGFEGKRRTNARDHGIAMRVATRGTRTKRQSTELMERARRAPSTSPK